MTDFNTETGFVIRCKWWIMLFLSEHEKTGWAGIARDICTKKTSPSDFSAEIRSNLIPAFYFYTGSLLASRGMVREGLEWLEAGAVLEEDGLFLPGFLIGYIERRNGTLSRPAEIFRDPRHFIHFAGVPAMKKAREHFIHQCGHSLPSFTEKKFRIMDIGCGDGGLTVSLLRHLRQTGKIDQIEEILLIDPSPAMASLAFSTVQAAFPETRVIAANQRIEDFTRSLDRHYDVALSSLAYHHMPLEEKMVLLEILKPWIDHFILFELDANNDTPECRSPELALSLYQSYGRIIDFVFSHDAPVEVAVGCVDSFLMAELVSLLSESRGARTDYHMLRTQWTDLFRTSLGPEFTLRSDSSCYADEYVSLFSLHYGREGQD
jgi:hypothetical protein